MRLFLWFSNTVLHHTWFRSLDWLSVSDWKIDSILLSSTLINLTKINIWSRCLKVMIVVFWMYYVPISKYTAIFHLTELPKLSSINTYDCVGKLQKSLIQHCERSELRLHFVWTNAIFAIFWKTEACGQTVSPDRSLLIEQNYWKMPKFLISN